jgi:hypothetical protein
MSAEGASIDLYSEATAVLTTKAAVIDLETLIS